MMLNNFPDDLHPMSQFSAAVTALNNQSKFAKAYHDGVSKKDYWEVRGQNTVFGMLLRRKSENLIACISLIF